LLCRSTSCCENSPQFIGEKLVSLDRIALGSPQNVPAGQYAKQAMDHVGVYAVLAAKKKLILAKDVRQALIYAERGEEDGAFVYQTDALLARNAEILFTVPKELYDRVAYPVVLPALPGGSVPHKVILSCFFAGTQ